MVSQLSSSLIRFYYDLLSGKFLPFKTPLSSRYDPELPEDARFNIDMIVSYVEGKQLRMGLVVDLTKTDRFYDKQTLLDRSIGYHKLQCEGFVRSICSVSDSVLMLGSWIGTGMGRRLLKLRWRISTA